MNMMSVLSHVVVEQRPDQELVFMALIVKVLTQRLMLVQQILAQVELTLPLYNF